MNTKTQFCELETAIGYRFRDPSLLRRAMTHSSYINEHHMAKTDCNESLEFLGDAVLEIVSSEYLYFHYPQEPEGKQPVPKKEPPKEDRKDNAVPLKKMSYKDQREYDGIGAEIAALEEKIAAAEGDMVECMTDYVRLQEISAEKEKLEAALEERMERWMELSELAEEIERNKR